MAIVFVCKNCEDRPCFYQCDKALSAPINVFDDGALEEPTSCPFGREAEWERAMPEATLERRLKYNLIHELEEWMSSDGWDKCPEELQELILGFGIASSCWDINTYKARQALGILCNYDYGQYRNYEEFKEDLKKYTKLEIVAGLLPAAIRIGVIWREKYLQEHGK